MRISNPILSPGDLVAIVAPASAINPSLIHGAADALHRAGLRVMIAPHAAGVCGSYSGTATERLNDLHCALTNPEVKAILCARGGYGCVHLLGQIEPRPVWLIGFSDVSALHALWQHHGLCSIHGSMAKELALSRCPGNEANTRLLNILFGADIEPIRWEPHSLNRLGTAQGTLRGGNLAVVNGLAGTPYDPTAYSGSILLIEDIGEPIYKVERMMHQMRLSGALKRLNGLIVGQFTDYRPDRNGESMEQMIARLTEGYDWPRTFNAPFGHVDHNLPLLLGASAQLQVLPSGVILTQ